MDKVNLNHVSKLMELYKYIIKNYNNNSLLYIKINNKYIKLNHDKIRAWNQVINKGKVTIKKPHV